MSSGSKNPNRNEIKIPVSDLKIGMFVAGLDRDWLETPFLLQGFFIRSNADIEETRKFCNHVYILGTGKREFGEYIDLDSSTLIGRTPQQYPIRTPAHAEYKTAKIINARVRQYVCSMFDKIRLGDDVDTKLARELVEASVDSIIRHPDAQTFMTKLRGQDEYTAEHCMNVCVLAIVFGRRLGLRKNQLVNLGLCGLLHDVGKIKVPDEILMKPGRFTDEEFTLMKLHTTFGKRLLERQGNVLQIAVDVAYMHHERPDGSGYPQGLGEKDLGMFSKIISIVDAYDAITGDRVYAAGRPSSEALRIIYEERGKQFDHDFALAFIQTIGVYPAGTIVELINGCIALVVDTTDGPRHLPTILLVLDEDKKPCTEKLLALKNTLENSLDKGFLIQTPLPDGCYGVFLKEYDAKGYFAGVI